jgi:hypothetical protein
MRSESSATDLGASGVARTISSIGDLFSKVTGAKSLAGS